MLLRQHRLGFEKPRVVAKGAGQFWVEWGEPMELQLSRDDYAAHRRVGLHLGYKRIEVERYINRLKSDGS
jgi:hypothetical protein